MKKNTYEKKTSINNFIYKLDLIINKEQLKNYLIKEKNSYTYFILEKMTKKVKKSKHEIIHTHHIIPRHYKGPNVKWNCVQLSLEDHIYAHKLLYINYGSYYDLAASNMLQGQLKKGFSFIQKQNQLNMKEKKIGFYNTVFQSELAKRPRKRRKSSSRNFFVTTALERGIFLKYVKTQEVIIIKPFETANVTEVINILMHHPQMKKKKQIWETIKKKEKSYGVSALTRILTGHIDKKTGKSLYSFMGWQLSGIFINKN